MAESSFELKEVIVWIIVAPMAWIWKQLNSTKTDLEAHKLKVAEEYIKKDDLKEVLQPLRDDLKFIRDKLDCK